MLCDHDLTSFLHKVFDDRDTVSATIESLEKKEVKTIIDLGAVIVWNQVTNSNDLPSLIVDKWDELLGGHDWEAMKFKLIGSAKVFCFFDNEKTGRIGLSELSVGMIRFGQGFSRTEVKNILRSLRADPDYEKKRTISFVEFARAFSKNNQSAEVVKGGLRQLFQSYNRNKSGSLDKIEMKKFLTKMRVEQSECAELIHKINSSSFNFDDMFEMLEASENTGKGNWTFLWLGLSFTGNYRASPKNVEAIEGLKQKAKDEGRNTKLVSFIRHGESEANRHNDLYGNSKGFWDPHITDRGVAQAKARGSLLAASSHVFDFELIVVSPLTRALETCATALASYFGRVPVIVHPLVVEQLTECDDIGKPPKVLKEIWEGYPIDWSLLPDKPEVWWYPGPSEVIPNPEKETMESQQKAYLSEQGEWTEPWQTVLKRAKRFENWLKARPERHICVVSHCGFIEALVGTSLGHGEQAVLEISLPEAP